MTILLEEEEIIATGKNRFIELFTVPRNRRGLQAASIVMFMQQCRFPFSRSDVFSLILSQSVALM